MMQWEEFRTLQVLVELGASQVLVLEQLGVCTQSQMGASVLTVVERPSTCALAAERSGTAAKTAKYVVYT